MKRCERCNREFMPGALIGRSGVGYAGRRLSGFGRGVVVRLSLAAGLCSCRLSVSV